MHQTYDPSYFSRVFPIEDRHFWFRARNRVIATLVSQITANLKPGYKVLEIGCGTGNVLRVLERACSGGAVVGMDLFADGFQYARQRTCCPLVQADVHALPFAITFDLIGMFDILEHLPDDVEVLCNLHAMLAPAGALLLTVPAHRSLWSYFDEVSHHCRRYGREELKSKLVSTGYRVEYLTEYMVSIFPLVWLGRSLAELTDRQAVDMGRAHRLAARDLRIIPVLNEFLAAVLAQEARLIARRRSLPIGTSLLAIARKDNQAEQVR